MNLQQQLTKFARRYKGRGDFGLARPANMALATQDRQAMRDQAVEGNPLNFVGDGLTRALGGRNGRVENTPDLRLDPRLMKREEEVEPQNGWGAALGKALGSAGASAATKALTKKEGSEGVENKEATIGTSLNTPDGKIVTTETIEQPPSRGMRDEIIRREGKDFKGADRDNDHNFKDVLRGLGLGALKALSQADPRQPLGTMLGSALGGGAAGAIGGAFDRNADEKLGNEMRLDKLYPQYERQFKRESAEKNQQLGEAYKDAQIGTIAEDDRRLREKADADARNKERKLKLDEATLDWKKEDRDRYFELEEIKERAKQQNNDRVYNLSVRKQEELMANNAANRESRERIAGMNVAGRANTAAIKSSVDAAKTIESIRAKGLELGADEEEINARINQFVQSLPANVRPK